MKIVLSGIFYPMAILRYFEAALKRRAKKVGDIELFTIGPFTGTRIPWNGGMDLFSKYANTPDFPLASKAWGLSYNYLETHLPWSPDIWIHVDAGITFSGHPCGKLAVVGTDPHVLDYRGARQQADVFFCMQTPYMKEGDEYLPYAFDPVWHRPPYHTLEESNLFWDLSLLGLHYPQRDQLIDKLEKQGLRINYDLGLVFDEARSIYNRSLMILNWSSRNDLTARVFEGAGLGNLVVCNRVPDLKKFFDERSELIVFEDMGDAVEKIIYYAGHVDEAREVAVKGHDRAVQGNYTWDARVDQIINTMKAL